MVKRGKGSERIGLRFFCSLFWWGEGLEGGIGNRDEREDRM